VRRIAVFNLLWTFFAGRIYSDIFAILFLLIAD